MLEVAGGILLAVVVLYFLREIVFLAGVGLVLGILLGFLVALYLWGTSFIGNIELSSLLLFVGLCLLAFFLWLERGHLRRKGQYELIKKSYRDSE